MNDAQTSQWSGYSLEGCVFEETLSAAPQMDASDRQLPKSIDMRVHCSRVEDQKNTNSCVAQTTIGALEFHQKKAGVAFKDMSSLFVYWNARFLAARAHLDGGSLIHHGLAAVMAHGACEDRLWPFDPSKVLVPPPMETFNNATKHEAVQYARTPLGHSVLTAVAEGLPVLFGTFMPKRFYEEAHAKGVMPISRDRKGPLPNFGHAMLIVGYDLADKTYLVRNSWGPQWGDQGYCRIPFSTLETWSRTDHFWAIGAIEQALGFKLSGPSMVDAMKGVGVKDDDLQVGGKALDRLRSDVRSRLSTDLETAKRDFRKRLRGE